MRKLIQFVVAILAVYAFTSCVTAMAREQRDLSARMAETRQYREAEERKNNYEFEEAVARCAAKGGKVLDSEAFEGNYGAIVLYPVCSK